MRETARRPGLALVVLLAASLVAAACDNGGGKTTGTTQIAANRFCEGVGMLAKTSFSRELADRPALLDALNQITNNAPRAIKTATSSLRGGAEQLLAILDQLPAATENGDAAQLEQLAQQAQLLSGQLAPHLQQVAAYVSENCPGVTFPPLPTVPTTPASPAPTGG